MNTLTNCQKLLPVIGSRLLFVGVYSQQWTLAQFAAAAAIAANHAVDCLIVKVADGAQNWYNPAQYNAIKSTIKNHGVGVIPYSYSYGNRFGAIDTEIGIMAEYLKSDGVFCADLESEWNGQVASAEHLAASLAGVPGTFLVSTFADPNEQNWNGVIGALNKRVAAYLPQQYTDFLASKWGEFAADGAACLVPTVSLTADFGANNAVAIAKAARMQGHVALAVWHYGSAILNPGLLDQVIGVFPRYRPAPAPAPNLYDTNPHIHKQFTDVWNSTAKITGALPTDTAIFKDWCRAWLAGHMFGAPITPEIQTVTHDGSAIIFQQFAAGQAEHANGLTRFYCASGEVMV